MTHLSIRPDAEMLAERDRLLSVVASCPARSCSCHAVPRRQLGEIRSLLGDTG